MTPDCLPVFPANTMLKTTCVLASLSGPLVPLQSPGTTTGAITIIDVAGEDTGNMDRTYPSCINGSGMIAGSYSTTIGGNSFARGFVRDTGGFQYRLRRRRVQFQNDH
jgi:hypothetical protein